MTPVTDTVELSLADKNSSYTTTSNISTYNTSSTTELSAISSRIDTATILKAVTITIGLVGILGNLFALLVFIYHQPLRKRIPNYFLINQSVLDLIVGFVLILNTTVVVDNPTGASLIAICFLFHSRLFLYGPIMTSTWNLVALAFERYMEIVHPIRHKLSLTKKKVVAAISGVILGCMTYKLILDIAVAKIIDGVCVTGWFPNQTSVAFGLTINAFLEFFLPVSLIAFCYIEMARAVRRKINVSTSGNSQMNRASKNILKILSIVVISVVVSAGPRQFLYLYFASGQPIEVNGEPFIITLILNYSSCCVNPFIYMLKYEEFQKEFHIGAMQLLATWSQFEMLIQKRSLFG
jgi:hypothetical protein